MTPLIKNATIRFYCLTISLTVLVMCSTIYSSKLLSSNFFNCLIDKIEDLP